MAHDHYHKDVSGLKTLDVYRVLSLFKVVHPCLQHAIKKLLCAGVRGGKDFDQDIQEAIDTLQRLQEMQREENNESEPSSLIDESGMDSTEDNFGLGRQNENKWIEWSDSNEPPIGRVEVKVRNGAQYIGQGEHFNWLQSGASVDIVVWRPCT